MSELELTSKSTVLDALLASLEQAATYNSNVLVAPAVILWPDKDEQWASIMPRLRELRPYCRRQSISHRARSAAAEPHVRMICLVELRRPHLMLSHAGCYDRFAVCLPVDLLDHVLRLQPTSLHIAQG